MEDETHVTTNSNGNNTSMGTDTAKNQDASPIKQDQIKSSKFVFDCC